MATATSAPSTAAPPAPPPSPEAPPAPPAMALTENLDEDVVDFIPNYDGQFQQPSVLPAAFPNLLVNGASGIAVGRATNMAPHNLIEVVPAATHVLESPDATTEELMEFVPGPDFPSGGILMGLEGVKDAYTSGRGALKVRGKVSVEQIGPRRTGIIVSELPYMVGPERLIEKIRDAVQSKKLQGISDVTDLTDRNHGLRVSIGIKTGFDPNAVLEQLYRLTPLEDSFSINNVALVDGQPRTLGLKEMLSVYVKHRLEVITRRSRYRLARREERLHLVEGLLIAILAIHEGIQGIRSSDDSEQARARLRSVFDLSELQAEYILELRLRRLTKFSRIELEAERDKLQTEIAELEALLSSRHRIEILVSDELSEIAERFGTARRTLLTDAPPSIAGASTRQKAAAVSLQVADVPCRVFLSVTGQIARVNTVGDPESATGTADDRRAAEVGGTGAGTGRAITVPSQRSAHDAVLSALATTSRTEVGAVTNRGRLIRFSPVDLPVLPPTSVQLGAGVTVTDYLGLTDRGERVLALVSLESECSIALGTKHGVVKRVAAAAYPAKPEFEIIALKPHDEVIGAVQGEESDELVFVTSDTQLLRFFAAAVRPQGCPAGGMAGINLAAGAHVIHFTAVPESVADSAVVVTIAGHTGMLTGVDSGSAKVSPFSEFPVKGRATGGVRAQRLLKGESALQLAWVGASPPLAVAADGSPRDLPALDVRRDGSGSKARHSSAAQRPAWEQHRRCLALPARDSRAAPITRAPLLRPTCLRACVVSSCERLGTDEGWVPCIRWAERLLRISGRMPLETPRHRTSVPWEHKRDHQHSAGQRPEPFAAASAPLCLAPQHRAGAS